MNMPAYKHHFVEVIQHVKQYFSNQILTKPDIYIEKGPNNGPLHCVLHIGNVVLGDAGHYKCRATNQEGSVFTVANVVVVEEGENGQFLNTVKGIKYIKLFVSERNQKHLFCIFSLFSLYCILSYGYLCLLSLYLSHYVTYVHK